MNDKIYNQLLTRATALTKNADKAADLVQETALKFYESYPNFNGSEEEMLKLLNTILTNTHIDLHRKHSEICFTDLEVEDDNGDYTTFEPIGGHGDISVNDVNTLINSLPTKIREAAILVLLRGLSYKEAAESLGITEAALTSRIHTAKKIIQKEMMD